MSEFNKTGFNEAIINQYKTDVLCSDKISEGLSAKKPENVDNIWKDANRYLNESGKNILDVLDFEYIFRNVLPESVFEAFDSQAIQAQTPDGERIREHVASTIQSSAFDRLFDTCIPQIFQDFSCPEAPFQSRDKWTTPIALDCRTNKFCEFIKPPLPDLCCMGEDESTPYYGDGCIRCWKTPTACKIKFAFGYNREMLCVDPNGLIRDHIASMASWFDEMDEYAIIKMLFGMEGCSPNGSAGFQNCRFPFNYQDTEYAAYLQASDNGPWTNLIYDEDLKIDGCSDCPLAALEKLFELERDHCTGRPMNCNYDLSLIIPCWADRYAFWRAMSPRLGLFTGGACNGACNTETRVEMPGREGWSTELGYSPYIYDLLVEYYQNCHDPVALDAATAAEWARSTYLLGNPREAIGFGTEWGLESLERSGTDTWEYWDREVVYQRKFMRKATPLWLKPWMVKLIRGFDPAVNPIP